MVTILRANNISKKYNPDSINYELQSTSISLEKGITYVIKGKSGSGKSTLLNILGGIDRPTSGSVFFKNRSFYDLSDKEQSKIRNKEIGFIFQNFNLIPELTIEENIELPKYFSKALEITSHSIKQISEELGIFQLLKKKPFQLSGGQQQRVAIARALITNPEIIFADEPTGNLDDFNSRNISNVLCNIAMKKETTVVIVTHQKNLIDYKHVGIVLEDGILSMEGKNA
ncbi:ABC transporter ATP-binding protein [Paenibacillus pinihumi]|uniref:ABC transporter ATP-binding protein n=1 Tax=Paenibacillus pinihumi TaxID=669462 RepID=UPI00048A7E06|nr:ABC transporter ATP-binding protein [Paenibacillus pinihumi]